MGLFLAMSCVVGRDRAAVEECLASYVRGRRGKFETTTSEMSHDQVARLVQSPVGTTFVYPSNFCEWDEVSAFLSKEPSASVFSFHIHDGDLWMFRLSSDGVEAAKFNPIPEYWEQLSDNERKGWLPSPKKITRHLPGVTPEAIAPYLREWPADGRLDRQKAHPDDEFEYGVDWQVVDFMRRLGFAYPDADNGISYCFRVRQER